jgi:hypothetical protein
MPTEVATTDSRLCTPVREVFMAAGDARTSENRSDRYLNDISEDELSANAPPTRVPKTRTLDMTATGSGLINADISRKLSHPEPQ